MPTNPPDPVDQPEPEPDRDDQPKSDEHQSQAPQYPQPNQHRLTQQRPPVMRKSILDSLRWPQPTEAANPTVSTAVGAVGLASAIFVPRTQHGIGWLLAAMVVAGALWTMGRRSAAVAHTSGGDKPRGHDATKVRPGWLLFALALTAGGALQGADWFFSLCALAAFLAGSLAIVRSGSVREMVVGAMAIPVAAFRGTPWALSGLRGGRGANPVRLLGSVIIGLGLLVVFGTLLASADAAFNEVLSHVMPDVPDAGRSVFLFVGGAVGMAGVCYMLATSPVLERAPRQRRPLRRVEWALPVGLLVGLFASFVGVQLAVLFGGEGHVRRTTGLTFAQYARGGFWQLLAVTALTLLVIAVATRMAFTRTVSDRTWLRGLLGGLACLTLVIVVSALMRMWAYQQAYGFTVLRLLVGACEVWLGVVYLLVLTAGVRLRAKWLPRAVVGAGMLVLLVLAVLNPERFVAERNVARYLETNRIDTAYLSRLSIDAVEPLSRLPEPARSCVLALIDIRLNRDTGDWRSLTVGRSRAHELTVGDLSASASFDRCRPFLAGYR